MSGTDDCASQEIEASNSSNSTRNSKKYSFVQSILNVNESQNLYNCGKQNIVLGDRVPALLPLEKREFIQNWILTHGNVNSPQKLCPGSPVLATIQNNSPAKRPADSQVLDYQWKRVRRDNNAKENLGVSLSGQSRQATHVRPISQTIVEIENEKPQDREPETFMNFSNNDSDKTCMNSPVLNGNTSSSTLNASAVSSKFSGGKASNERRSGIRESSIIPETLSLSSPLGGIERAQIDCKRTTKQSQRDIKNGGRNGISGRLSWIAAEQNPLKLKARQALKRNDRRSLDHDDRKSCEKLSSSFSFGGSEDIAAEKDTTTDKQDRLSRRLSWIRAKNSPIKLESGSTSRNNSQKNLVRQSSKLLDTLSVSSLFCESDRIDVESSTTNPAEEEIKIESDSDDVGNDVIENIETQNQRALLTRKDLCKIEDASPNEDERKSKRLRDASCDSDETYYSDGHPVSRLQVSVSSSLKYSQKISQDKSDILISQVASPIRQNVETSVYVAPLNTWNDNSKKKKKAKKGSLLAKLQTLVSLQVSSLRIWRHQMSQSEFKGSHTQFVTLRVRERETRWSRHFITASVIADSQNLLKSLFTSETNSTSQNSVSSFEARMVTLMIVPEVTGMIKIRADSTLNIYPPWEIMDRDKRILNVMYFDVTANLANVAASDTLQKHTCERIIQKFDCPCIRAKAVVESCPEKFSENKPSVMRALFGS